MGVIREDRKVNQNSINELESLTPIEEVPDNKENYCSKCKQVQPIEESQKYLWSVCIGLCVLMIIGLIIALVVVVYQPVKHGATKNLTLDLTPIPTRPEPTTDLTVSSDPDPPGEQVNRDQITGVKIRGGGSIGMGEVIMLQCGLDKLDQRDLRGDIYWWINSKEISDKDKSVTIMEYRELGISILMIGNATEVDSGKYTCQWLKDGVSVSAVSVDVTVVKM